MACRSSVAPVAFTGAEIEIGPNGERHPTLTLRILIGAQLDDRAGRAVAGCVEVRQPDVMRTAVHTVDDGVGGPFQLVVKATLDQSADDGHVEAFAGQHVARRSAFDAALGQRAVHTFDDVAAFAEFAQDGFRFRLDEPLGVAYLPGDAEGFERAQAADLQRMKLVRLAICERGEIDDAGLAGVADELPIELGPPLCRDLAFEAAADIKVGAWPQLMADEIARAVTHPSLM